MFTALQINAVTFPFDPNALTPATLNLLVLLFVKILFLIGFGLYIVFAFLAIRQVEEMRSTVITTLSSFVRLIVYIHFIVAVLFFLFALAFLP